jgi:hypothetical protein
MGQKATSALKPKKNDEPPMKLHDNLKIPTNRRSL